MRVLVIYLLTKKCDNMKNAKKNIEPNDKNYYVAPQIEIEEILIEKGFLQTYASGSGYGTGTPDF